MKKYLAAARENFKKGDTYKARKTYVPLPVYLGEKLVDNLTAEELRPTCNMDRWCVLIQGEGGLGKTTLACQLALWAILDNPSESLCEHRLMLPVLIEPGLDFDVRQDMSAFHGELHGRLQRLIGAAERVPEELFEKLLRTRRILLILDGLSEMASIAETPETARPEHKDFLVNALIITSRTKEKVAADATIFPSRINRDHLIPFMNAYLTGAGHHLEDSALFQACGRLADMVGVERDITPLLAKLYVEGLIASAKDGKLPRELPDNIPDLMLSYLNELNRNVPKKNRLKNPTIHRYAKVLAWESLKEKFRPASVRIDHALAVLADEEAPKNLKYLEDKLRLIKIEQPAEDRFTFLLDPLAEYLAALHLLGLHGEKEHTWKNFLTEADKKQGAPEATKGFLLAVRDCIIAKGEEAKVPAFVADELAKRAGLDMEAIKQAQKEQRIQRLINQLGVPEAEDRKQAAFTIGEIGHEAEAAVPALIEALEDKDENVRWRAAWAIGNIGIKAHVAMPHLIKVLKDKNESVCQQTKDALHEIGPATKDEVPAIIDALKDKDKNVRWGAAWAIGKIGPEAHEAVPKFIEVFNDPDEDVRRKAAEAVGRIGAKAESDLIKVLKNSNVKFYTAQALEIIGPKAEASVPFLGEALKDECEGVRYMAAKALGKIGPEAKVAVPALKNALKDQDESIRGEAAQTLGIIGPAAKDAVPALINMVKDKNRNFIYAISALGRIGSGSKTAALFLIDLLKDESPTVRSDAEQALEKINTPEALMALEEYKQTSY